MTRVGFETRKEDEVKGMVDSDWFKIYSFLISKLLIIKRMYERSKVACVINQMI